MRNLIRKILKESENTLLSCVDCKNKTEAYFVKDEIWDLVPKTKRKGSICLSCLEKRLGRKLKKSDFKNSDIHNYQPWWSSLKESEFDWLEDLSSQLTLYQDRRGKGYLNADGQRVGPWEYYYESGNLSSKGEYLNGKEIGVWELYNNFNGGLEAKGEYLNGKEIGPWEIYHENGNLREIINY